MVLVIEYNMNRIKKVISHPLLIVFLFSLIAISGEQMGGLYLFYLLLGLPHLIIHSVLGLVGICFLLFSSYNTGKTSASIFNLLGACCMIGSLLFFFLQPEGSYNYNTFYEIFTLTTLILFGAFIAIFIIQNLISLFHIKQNFILK
jgi:hypothetical protein